MSESLEQIKSKIAQLSPKQRELLQQRLNQRKSNSTDPQQIKPENSSQFEINQPLNPRKITAIKPVSREKEIPLSFAQQRLWFLDQLEGKSETYNIPTALKIEGKLNLEALKETFKQISQRHEVLRTNFQQKSEKATQEIATETEIEIPIINLEKIGESEKSSEVTKQINQEANQPFNLSKDVLIRVKLIKLAAENQILIITIHHIISDGWSMGILINEIGKIYTAITQEQEQPLPPLSIQYADFTVWQKEYLTGEILEKQTNYWKEKLAGIPPLLEIPTDKPRPAKQTFKGSREKFQLDRNLTEKLKRLSQKYETTLFMTLLGGLAVFLYRYSQQTDVVIGSPIANRNRAEIENLIGFFVNTLVFRTNLENNPSFTEVLNQVKTNCLEAYEHQDIPFEKLVEELQPERNLSYAPIFQVMFVLQNTPKQEWELPNLKLSRVEIERESAKFDLTISMTETETEIRGVWEYSTDLFERETIQRMIGNFQTLLEGIVENPEEKVSLLPILTEVEKQKILVEWNHTKTDYPKDKCIHQLFEEQVEKTPDAIAVVFEEKQLTYKELNEKANQLGHYLQELGVKPETLVGICVERSVEMVIGLLGILKAGGAYVPLDPNYPIERLNYILNETQLSILVTQNKLSEQIPKIEGKVVFLDDTDIVDSSYKNNIQTQVSAENIAYIIYTSGSTGKPKGVIVEHKSVVNFLYFKNFKLFTEDERQVTFSTSSIGFDASVSQFFSPLLIGGKVIIINGVEELLTWLNQEKIVCLTTVPSLLEQLLNNFSLPNSLRVIALGGESITQNILQKLLQYNNIEKVINLYGPTETTICSSTGLIN